MVREAWDLGHLSSVTTRLRPFFSFYGSKWRASWKYPAPDYHVLIEPFAGSAGYALNHPERAVWLHDLDPVITGLWRYLIGVTEAEILSLPIVVEHADDLHVCEEARALIGFWLNKGMTRPCKIPSAWMRSGEHGETQFWGEAIRARVARQLESIRHWTVTEGSYEVLPECTATWFIDPPYADAGGRHYRCSTVDYDHLSAWCQSRRGQVIVCEHEEASWLPFTSIGGVQSTFGRGRQGVSAEAVWLSAA